MNDFIRKKDVLSMFCYTQCEIRNEDGKQCEWPCLAYTQFANIPAEDVVERKKGEWLRTNSYPHRVYCSKCFGTYVPNDRWTIWEDKYHEGGLPRDFCPNCGADMKGEEE